MIHWFAVSLHSSDINGVTSVYPTNQWRFYVGAGDAIAQLHP